MADYVQSSPVFFRLIRNSFLLFAAILLAASFFVAAPLDIPADLARVPNPVKSAWFLLWIQELVSYSSMAIYPVLAVVVAFLLVPYWPQKVRKTSDDVGSAGAYWQLGPIQLVALLILTMILVLTGIALFFRGANWAFVL